MISPLPGLIHTRATAFLRRPVAYDRPIASRFGSRLGLSAVTAVATARSFRSASVRVVVPDMCSASPVLRVQRADIERDRLLAVMRMGGAGIDVQMLDLDRPAFGSWFRTCAQPLRFFGFSAPTSSVTGFWPSCGWAAPA